MGAHVQATTRPPSLRGYGLHVYTYVCIWGACENVCSTCGLFSCVETPTGDVDGRVSGKPCLYGSQRVFQCVVYFFRLVMSRDFYSFCTETYCVGGPHFVNLLGLSGIILIEKIKQLDELHMHVCNLLLSVFIAFHNILRVNVQIRLIHFLRTIQ